MGDWWNAYIPFYFWSFYRNRFPIHIPYQGTLYQVDEKTGTITRIKAVKDTVPLLRKGIFWIVKKT